MQSFFVEKSPKSKELLDKCGFLLSSWQIDQFFKLSASSIQVLWDNQDDFKTFVCQHSYLFQKLTQLRSYHLMVFFDLFKLEPNQAEVVRILDSLLDKQGIPSPAIPQPVPLSAYRIDPVKPLLQHRHPPYSTDAKTLQPLYSPHYAPVSGYPNSPPSAYRINRS